MKCDLHVHTVHSGMCTVPLARMFCRESYTQPDAAYGKLKRLGMNLVTITDHNSIGACDVLRSHPDFFLSEEVTCQMPGGRELHIGVYDLNERQHIEIHRRSSDIFSLVSYLREQNLFFSVNHVFSRLTGQRDTTDFDLFDRFFPAVEILNGAILPVANRNAELLARRMGKSGTGGSDAHTLAGVGSVYTEVPGARSKSEFFQGLRLGHGVVRGKHGGFFKLTADVFQICCEMMAERPWTRLTAPVLAALPGVLLLNYLAETHFACDLQRRLERAWMSPNSAVPVGAGTLPESV